MLGSVLRYLPAHPVCGLVQRPHEEPVADPSGGEPSPPNPSMAATMFACSAALSSSRVAMYVRIRPSRSSSRSGGEPSRPAWMCVNDTPQAPLGADLGSQLLGGVACRITCDVLVLRMELAKGGEIPRDDEIALRTNLGVQPYTGINAQTRSHPSALAARVRALRRRPPARSDVPPW
jgi:hypothetical protein